ncbi:MAG TPA: extracellular solute-binding protein [Chloroflexota bacterium]|nr:extracellular solute-binding protein [Chloroflexota bacterium]
MKRALLSAIPMLLLALAGCGSSGAATSPASASGKPGGASSASATSEWDSVLAAAKKEGTVSLIGPTGDARRDSLTQPFQKQYGIQVDYLADDGAGIGPRVTAERGANKYLWDAVVTGTTTGLINLGPLKMLDPLEPELMLPEVTDPKQWRGGAIEFVDAARQIMVMTPFQRGTLYINRNQVAPDSITSYKDLLDPKWKGKLLSDDPRKAGPGQATFTFFYRQPDLGPDFIRALAKQNLTFMTDYSQELDAVGQGRNPLLIGGSDAIAEQRIKQGVPLAIVDARQIKEGTDISPASGALSVFNNRPHPNAAKIYVNWLLSKEGQTSYAVAAGYISARLDVATDQALPWRLPAAGAIKTYDQEAIDLKPKLDALLKEVLPS